MWFWWPCWFHWSCYLVVWHVIEFFVSQVCRLSFRTSPWEVVLWLRQSPTTEGQASLLTSSKRVQRTKVPCCVCKSCTGSNWTRLDLGSSPNLGALASFATFAQTFPYLMKDVTQDHWDLPYQLHRHYVHCRNLERFDQTAGFLPHSWDHLIFVPKTLEIVNT